MRVDAETEGLARAVKDEQRVDEEKIEQRSAEAWAGGGRNAGLEARDVLVGEEADRPAGEARHSGQGNRPVTAELVLEQRERIGGRRDGNRRTAGLPDLGGRGSAGQDAPRPAADEAVAGEVLAALHRLE